MLSTVNPSRKQARRKRLSRLLSPALRPLASRMFLSDGLLGQISGGLYPSTLRRRTPVPPTFELMDGRASLEEIAHKLVGEFPTRFSSWQQALSYAGLISQEFSR